MDDKVLSIIEVDSTRQSIQYLSSLAMNGFPLMAVDGTEVKVYILPEQFDVFKFTNDLLTVSGLATFCQETNLQNILNLYEIVEDESYFDLLTNVSKIDFEFDGDNFEEENELVLEYTERDVDLNQVNITNNGPSGRLPHVYVEPGETHSRLYNSMLNVINNIISTINSERWIERIEESLSKNPLTAKRNLLEEGVDDKIELIQQYTAPDFLALKTLTINLGTELVGTPIGDPVYLYLDQETNTDTYQFRYVDSLGEKTPVQYQHMATQIVSKTAQTAVPGSYVQLSINYTTDSGTIDYDDGSGAVPCTYNGSDILWFGIGGSGQELTMIKIEKALYNTKSFWIDVDENRIIIYPKADFEEYRINSAILTNVM